MVRSPMKQISVRVEITRIKTIKGFHMTSNNEKKGYHLVIALSVKAHRGKNVKSSWYNSVNRHHHRIDVSISIFVYHFCYLMCLHDYKFI